MTEKQEQVVAQIDSRPIADDNDEPDEWDQRIDRTGCADQNAKLTDCYFEHKDWRSCTAEMIAFQQCWRQNNNDERTATKDSDKQNK
ncbi:unnamed protein product [Parascedosporium putredinis]|uniref:CHCH domain-containing protein n=1 Tax=Parascedosporium putredinis TaxID=1442378 RepID=A0A9P1GZZ8_9PEZI|nr:unnamed protein product [Parascedosporium putredinis]CAI7992287.1 unnamed protein product [Parascedosporium putredinis]